MKPCKPDEVPRTGHPRTALTLPLEPASGRIVHDPIQPHAVISVVASGGAQRRGMRSSASTLALPLAGGLALAVAT